MGAGAGIDIAQLAKELGRPMSSLIALSHHADPFNCVTPGMRRQAQWFADLFCGMGFGPGTHLRRIHYRLISQDPPGLHYSGEPYVNTLNHWKDLASSSKFARYLGLVPVDWIIDRRSREPLVIEPPGNEEAAVFADGDGGPEVCGDACPLSVNLSDDDFPDLPTIRVAEPVISRPYAIEIWVEKSTMEDILEPIARRRGASLVTGVGELSITRCHELVARVLARHRPTRILYISDLDPKGLEMPVSVARKVEFFLRKGGHEADVIIYPIALTEEQANSYDPPLPRSPIKEGDRSRDSFESRYGEGSTELDAIEALHPGDFQRIVEAAIDRYEDPTLEDRISEVRHEALQEAGKIIGDVRQEFAGEIAAAQSGWRDTQAAIAVRRAEIRRLFNEINSLLDDWKDLASPLWRGFHAMLEEQISDSGIDDIDWPEYREIEEIEAPLYDNSRGYVEQIDRYKAHQGKPTGYSGRMANWKIARPKAAGRPE